MVVLTSYLMSLWVSSVVVVVDVYLTEEPLYMYIGHHWGMTFLALAERQGGPILNIH